MQNVCDLTLWPILSLSNAVYSNILAVTAIIYEATFSILIYVLNSFSLVFNAALRVFSVLYGIVSSFISGTFIMILSCFNFIYSILFSIVSSFITGASIVILSCFNFILSAIVNIFNGILTVISSLKYASLNFVSYFEPLLILDTKRMVLLLLLVVMVWQLWKMRQRRLAFDTEWKRVLQHRSNSSHLDFSGTSWKSGNFEGKEPNFSRVSSWESGDFNRILDFALRELCHRCRGNISAGPLHFTDKVPLLQTDWLFKAEDCVLKHLDTAHRVGCATTREEPGDVLVLDATIALRKLRVSIMNYFAHVVLWLLPSIHVSGNFVGTVESLTLRMEVALTTPFAAKLRSLSITNMGTPQVHITGLGIFGTFLWNMLQSSLFSRKRLENFIKPIFEGVLQDLTRHVSDNPSPRQERLTWDEVTVTRQIEVQNKVREVTTIQTIKYGTKQNEVRPLETTSTVPRYQKRVRPRETTSTVPRHLSEVRPRETTSTVPRHQSEVRPRETTSTVPRHLSEVRPRETTSTVPRHQSESRRRETASTLRGYRAEVFPQEVRTIQTIREYESHYRDTRQMHLAMAQERERTTEAIVMGVTAGLATVGAICGITSLILSSRSRSNN